MDEKRKHKRRELDAELIIKNLDSGSNEETKVTVFNLSKSGIGFSSDEILQIGGVYETNLTIWTKESFHCFIEIVRIEIKPDFFDYGAIFIGMPEADLQRIEVYNIVQDRDEYI